MQFAYLLLSTLIMALAENANNLFFHIFPEDAKGKAWQLML